MNILPALKTHLVNQGVTTPIKLAYIPDKPADVIAIIDTGGVEPDANDTAAISRQHKSFQVYVRGLDYDAITDTLAAIRTALINRIKLSVDGIFFENIIMQSEFQPIGKDATGREEFTANFTARVIDTENTGYVPGAQGEGLRRPNVGELNDVSFAGDPEIGQTLIWNGTAWELGTPDVAPDLTGIATETYVDQAIDAIPDVTPTDLSDVNAAIAALEAKTLELDEAIANAGNGQGFRYIGATIPDTTDWQPNDLWYDTSTEVA